MRAVILVYLIGVERPKSNEARVVAITVPVCLVDDTKELSRERHLP